MVEITYHRRALCLEAKGHAGGGRGKNTVCAAVTALVGTLDAALAELKAQGAVSRLESRIDSGDAEIKCIPKRRMESVVRLTFDTVCIGLSKLAEAHPDRVSIKTI